MYNFISYTYIFICTVNLNINVMFHQFLKNPSYKFHFSKFYWSCLSGIRTSCLFNWSLPLYHYTTGPVELRGSKNGHILKKWPEDQKKKLRHNAQSALRLNQWDIFYVLLRCTVYPSNCQFKKLSILMIIISFISIRCVTLFYSNGLGLVSMKSWTYRVYKHEK